MLGLLFLALLAAPALGRSTIKIIGGQDAQVGQFPYIGSIRAFGSHWCGCALVTQRYCVSAAHCTEMSAGAYDVQFGITKRSQPGNGQTISVSTIYNHPSYENGPGAIPNDISIIFLAANANLGNNLIATIPMANSGQNFGGQSGTISGWGYTQTGGSTVTPDHLQFVNINVFTQAQCIGYWGSNTINDGHICVGNINSAGACGGDSGGPLAVNGVLVGVTSFGLEGCFTRLPSVYSSIPYFRNWINGIIN